MIAIHLANKDPFDIILEHIEVIKEQLDKISTQAERLIKSGKNEDDAGE